MASDFTRVIEAPRASFFGTPMRSAGIVAVATQDVFVKLIAAGVVLLWHTGLTTISISVIC